MVKLKNLEGIKVNLIPLDLKHIDDMYEYSGDEKFYEHLEYEPHKSKKDTEKYLIDLIERSEEESNHIWFIQLKDTKKVIGSFGVHNININRNSCELGFGLSSLYWGKRIFSDTMKIVLEYLIKDLSFHRITITTSKNNIRTIKSIKKFNFEEEGVLKDFYCDTKKNRFDAVIYSLVQK